MPVPTNRQARDGILASDINNIAALANANEAGIAHVTARASGAFGLGLVDETAALQSGLDNAAGGTFEIGAGIYLFTQLTVRSDTRVIAHQDAVLKPGPTNQSAILFDSPTPRLPTTTYQLTADSVVGAFSVTVSLADAALLAVGQRVQLRDATYTLGGENVRRETNVIEAINLGSGLITLREPVGHVYTAANDSWIAPVSMATRIRWEGGVADMSGVAGGIAADCNFIDAIWPEDCTVSDVTVHHHPDKGISLYGGLNSHIIEPKAYAPSRVLAGEGYCAQLSFCRNCTIEGGWSQNVRHHADIISGQHNGIIGGRSSGRTVDDQTGAFLHGMESRWCYIRGFAAENIDVAVGAGNGTFAGDFDFTIEDCTSTGCDNAAVVFKSSGTVKRLKVRAPLSSAIVVTNTGLDVDIVDPDIDMDTANLSALATTGLVSGNRVRLRGGTIKMNNASASAVNLSVPAGAELLIEGTTFIGTMLRALSSSGASTERTVRSCSFRGTITEALRIDAGELKVVGNDFGASGINTAVRAATGASMVLTLAGNSWGGVTTKVSNTSGATIVGPVDMLSGTATWDPASIANGASLRQDVTVTGAAVGDPAYAGFSSIAATGWDVTANVRAANTVEVKITNNTGGAVDLASGTLRATVLKQT